MHVGAGLSLVVSLLTSASAFGQMSDTRQFLDLSLEELLEVEVSSITGRTQKLPESAAAIYVMTADEIARSSALSIPDLLRTIPGLQVAQIDSNKWAVSARGFNSRISSKLLVIIDGRNIYSPTFGTVFWETEDLNLSDIERIEVIRGPGATIWGANAVNGVVSITTKSSRNTEGGELSVVSGTLETNIVSGRVGGRIGLDTSYRIYGKYREQNEFSTRQGNGVGDFFHMNRVGFRVDSQVSPQDGMVFLGGMYQQNIRQNVGPVESFTASLPAREDLIEQDGGFLEASWTRDISKSSSFKTQVYYDKRSVDNATTEEDYETIDLDFRWSIEDLGKHTVTLGAGARLVEHRYNSSAYIRLMPEREILRLFNISIHDDWGITDRAILGFSLKLEDNIYTGLEYQPNLSFNYALSDEQHLWLAATRSVRTPSRAERSIDFVVAKVPVEIYPGVSVDTYLQVLPTEPAMAAERLSSIEAGWRYQKASFNLDIAIFSNKYDRLRSVSMGELKCVPVSFCVPPVDYAVLPLELGNGDAADTEGVEVLLSYKFSDTVNLEAGYTFYDIDYFSSSPGLTGGINSLIPDRNGPLTKFTAELNWQRDSSSNINIAYRQVSDPGLPGLDGYAVMDFVIKKTFQNDWSLHAGGRNLFDAHEEFREDLLNSPAAEIGQLWYLELAKKW